MNIVRFFKKNQPDYESDYKTDDSPNQKEIFKPIYRTSDLKPPVFDDDEYETAESQQYRFSNLHPITVLCEVADVIDGKVTRTNPFEKSSTPIILKKLKNINISIMFYKNKMNFAIYQNFFDDPVSKMITSRKTVYGLQKAIEMIENGEYNEVLI